MHCFKKKEIFVKSTMLFLPVSSAKTFAFLNAPENLVIVIWFRAHFKKCSDDIKFYYYNIFTRITKHEDTEKLETHTLNSFFC